ncbi:MAG: HAMP domain-containing sensor histidine kinase [Myxococcota bacterium]
MTLHRVWSLVPQLPLRAWLLVSHAAVLIAPILVLLGSGTLTTDLRAQTFDDLQHQGALIAMLIRSEVLRARIRDEDAGIAAVAYTLNAALNEAKAQTLSGIRVVDRTGQVVATSGQVLGEDLSADREVLDALDGRIGLTIRPRPPSTEVHPLGSPSRRATVRVFVAVPVVVEDAVIGAIVLSRTPRDQLEALYQMSPGIAGAAVVAAVGTSVLAGIAAWVSTRSLASLGRGAERIADGDFGGLGELTRPRRSHLVEVAHTATAIATMTERLRDRLAYISEFASNVSHEFKTPIATLRATIELLAEDDAMPPEQRARFLANAARELDRLERMVTGLLSLARADEASPREPLGLHAVLTEVAAAAGVPLDGVAADVRGDRSQLEAVAVNLIENARRHGGPGVRITVEAFTEPAHTGFRVVDDGRGISEANLPRVFDRFFTTDRAAGGTGLGLALVRAIVVRHGGEVAVDSAPGRTAFSVRLPRG